LPQRMGRSASMRCVSSMEAARRPAASSAAQRCADGSLKLLQTLYGGWQTLHATRLGRQQIWAAWQVRFTFAVGGCVSCKLFNICFFTCSKRACAPHPSVSTLQAQFLILHQTGQCAWRSEAGGRLLASGDEAYVNKQRSAVFCCRTLAERQWTADLWQLMLKTHIALVITSHRSVLALYAWVYLVRAL
jgi:hypothetical protein